MKSFIVYAYISLILFTSHLGWSKIIYVNLAATGENTGMSWTDAYADLQIALASAEGNDEIWVAEGRYTPASSGGGRDSTFQLPPGVSLYGGFIGTEETLVERLWNKHKTTLSGDLMGNDNEGEEESRVENSYHVVTITGTGNNALLDGFIIRDGNADADGDVFSPHPQKGNGGGIHIDGTGRGESLGPSILNCEFRNNSTIFPESSDIPGIGLGGGIHIIDSNVRIENCYFTQNSSFRGGGLSVDSSSTVRLINSLFYNNSATIEGGAIYNKSGITFCTNCTIVRNRAKKDAAIYFGPESTTITNSIVWGNRLTPTEDEPDAHFFVNSTFDVSPTRKAILSYSIVQIRENIEPEEGSAVVNPKFIDVNDPDGSDDLFFTEDDGLQLSRNSVGIDASRSDTTDFSPLDILGNGRVDDMGIANLGLGIPDFVDLGAYERQTNSFFLLTVTHDGNGSVSPSQPIEFVPGTIRPRINAFPNPGYEFDVWSADSEEDEIGDVNQADTTIAITKDTTVTAHFRVTTLKFGIAEMEPFLVPVDGSRSLNVSLSGPPAETIAATASIQNNDDPIFIMEGENELVFTPDDWSENHKVILTARERINTTADMALLTITQSTGKNPVTTRNVMLKVNEKPTIRIVSPRQGSRFAPPTTIDLSGKANDKDGTVDRIDVFADNVFIGEAGYDIDTDEWDFSFVQESDEIRDILFKAVATDNIGSTTESDPTLVHLVDFMFAFNRPGPDEEPVAVGDRYRYSWTLPLELPKFEFDLYLFDQPQLTFEQIQGGKAVEIARNLDNAVHAFGFTHNNLPARPSQPQTTWYPHILIRTPPRENTIISGDFPLTVVSTARRQNVAITIIDPKKNDDVVFGQSVPVQAIITSAAGDSIIGSNGVIVRFKNLSGDSPAVEIDESSDNGLVVLNDDFVPDAAGLWSMEIDWLGNVQFNPNVTSREFNVKPGETTIVLGLQGATHVLGRALRIAGLLRIRSLNPGNVDLSGVEVKFRLTDPNEESRSLSTVLTSNNETGLNGQFEITIPGTVFDMEGRWQLQAFTEGNANLTPSESDTVAIRVLQKPGYAILCLGSVEAPVGKRPEGVDDHRRTMDYIKTVLTSDAGLADDPENPNSLTDDIYEISYGDPKTELEEAIKEWAAQKMIDAPAPLYIALINHGEMDKFHMHADLPNTMDNILVPSELNAWLTELEEALLNPDTGSPLAAEEKITVVLGMCFSGSFIDELSKDGRIIISSSASNERSIRGPNDSDLSDPLARHGEYFVYLLFRELSNGLSLLEGFRASRDHIRQVSDRFELATNSVGPEFPGELGQHPLLDDNGDGKGSFTLSKESGDGKIAENVFLVTPTNSIGTFKVARTHPSVFLGPDDDVQGGLWAEVDERPRNVNSVFMEVKKPGNLDADAGDPNVSESMQAGLELVKQLMIPDDSFVAVDRVRYQWPGLEPDLELFNQLGAYQILYYVKAEFDFQPSEPKVSFVYRRSGETDFSRFHLLSPEDGATVDFNEEADDLDRAFGVFRWEESLAEDGKEVHYIFRLWHDENRSRLVFETGLMNPTFVSFDSDELPRQMVYWDVVAVDAQGNFRMSDDLFRAEIVQTGPPPIVGGIAGTIVDKITKARITAPGTIIISNDERAVQTSNNVGFFTKKIRRGTYTIRADITGYLPLTLSDITIQDGSPLTLDLELERPPEPFSERRLKISSSPPGVIALIEGTQRGLTGFETTLNDNVSVQVKAPTTIIDGDTGYRFLRWRKSTTTVPEEEVVERPDFPSFLIDADTNLVADYEEIGLDLEPGWNLVSRPVNPQSVSEISDIFNIEKDLFNDGKPVWKWVNGQFRLTFNVEQGIGYWVNAAESQLIPTRGTPPATSHQILRKGWNLVGVRGFKSIPQPTDANVIGPIWAWDNENQRYYPVDSELIPEITRGRLMPGNAYWIYANGLTSLELGLP